MVSATQSCVLPLMRAQGGGRIVNVSSVAAPLAIPFQAWYSVSKAAVNAYTLALFNEVKQFWRQRLRGDARRHPHGLHQPRAKRCHAGRRRLPGPHRPLRGEDGKGRGKRHDSRRSPGRFLARVALKKRVKPYYAIGLVLQVLRAALAHPAHPPDRLAAGAAVRGGMTFKPVGRVAVRGPSFCCSAFYSLIFNIYFAIIVLSEVMGRCMENGKGFFTPCCSRSYGC